MGHAAAIHCAEIDDIDEAIHLAQEMPLTALKKRLQRPQRGRPRSDEKTRMLAALERAITMVKAGM
jgi:hypothetical protein